MNKTIDVVIPEYTHLLQTKFVFIDREDVLKDLLKIPVHAIAKYLGLKKSRQDENGTALAVREDDGTLIIAGVVKYHKPEKEDQAGNWSFEFVFEEEDIKDAHTYLIIDTSFEEILQKVSIEHRVGINNKQYASVLITCLFNAIKNTLRANVTPTEEVEIECEGYYTAIASVEGDEVVLALLPSGEMKRLIKDDSYLEV